VPAEVPGLHVAERVAVEEEVDKRKPKKWNRPDQGDEEEFEEQKRAAKDTFQEEKLDDFAFVFS